MPIYDMFDTSKLYQCPIGNEPERCKCGACEMQRQWDKSAVNLKQAEASNFGYSMPSTQSTLLAEPQKKTVKEKIAAQRLANIEANDQAFEATQTNRTPQVTANTMFWPPYNPLAPQGQKDIHVEYVEPIVSIAVLSLEEAQELYVNLGGKDTISDTKSYTDLAKGSAEAYATAKGLGGLGVKASTKIIRGREWVIIRDFRRHDQTLLRGNKWTANNPKVVRAGLGLNDLKGAARYIKFNAGLEIAFAVGVNVADYILSDEATLAELGVNAASDLVKGFVSLSGAAFVAAALPATATVLATGLVFAIASYFIGKGLNHLDTQLGYSKDITTAVETYFQ